MGDDYARSGKPKGDISAIDNRRPMRRWLTLFNNHSYLYDYFWPM
jgi:hypothetical protein